MSTVDLHELRCAVATLVCAVGCGGQLDPPGMRRVDTAVAVLSMVRAAHTSGRGVADAIDRLLRPARDPGGVRTLAAIEELAELMNVDAGLAPALASGLQAGPLGQRQLFDPDGG